MVELLEADPSLGVKGAATIVARGMKGSLSRNVERLRKKYCKLREKGRLPKGGATGRFERRARAVREYYASRKASILDAKRQLVAVEKEAERLGLDPHGDLRELELALIRQKESLDHVVLGPIDIAISGFLERGVTDPEEAVAHLAKMTENFRKLEMQIDVVRRLRDLHAIADRAV